MRTDPVRVAIDRLTTEKGTKEGYIWKAFFSVKDVLEKAGMKNTPDNQRYVVYVISKWYEGSKSSPGQGDNGGFLEVKIRSI